MIQYAHTAPILPQLALMRGAWLQVHARKHKFADDADLKQLANDTPGLVGADLANTLNNAAILAVRDKSTVIRAKDLAVRIWTQNLCLCAEQYAKRPTARVFWCLDINTEGVVQDVRAGLPPS